MSEKTVSVRLSANVDAYKRAMAEAQQSTKKFEQSSGADLNKVGATMASVGSKMTVGVTLPIAAAGAGALKLSSDFNTAFAQMVGLAGIPAGEVDALKQSVLELAGETAQAPQALAEALYFAASAGLDSAGAMDAVTIAAQGARAGMGSTQDIVGLVASAVASYGEANITAAEATDILTSTIREGRADPAELAGSLGRVLPVAAALGVSFGEVGGTVAYLSNVFGDTDRTVTAVNDTFAKLGAPTEDAKLVLSEFGTSAEELQSTIRDDGLLAGLELLRDKGFAGNMEAVRRLMPDMNGAAALMALLTDESGSLAGTLGETTNATGSLQEALGALDVDVEALKQSWVDIQVALIQVGEIIGPIAAEIAGGVSSIAGAFADLPTEVQYAVVGLVAFVAAIGPMLRLTGTLIMNLAAIKTAMILLKAAMVGHPLLAFAAVAATVGAAVYLMSERVSGAEKATDALADAMVAAGSAGRGLADWLLGLTQENESLVRVMDEAGVTITEVASAARAGGDAWDEMSGRLSDASEAAGLNKAENQALSILLRGMPTLAKDAADEMAARARVDDTAAAAAASLNTEYTSLAEQIAAGSAVTEDSVSSTEDATAAWEAWADATTAAAEAAAENYADMVNQANEWMEGIRSSMQSGSESFFGFTADVETSAYDFAIALAMENQAHAEWEQNLATVFDSMSGMTEEKKAEFIGYLSEMGSAGAPMVADLAKNSGMIQPLYDEWVRMTEGTGDGMIGGLDPVAGGMEAKMKHADGLLHQQLLLSRSRANVSARELGGAIPAGMAVGITQGQGSLNSTIASMVNQAVAAAKLAAGIRSPSRLFAEGVGKPIAAGIAEGVAEDADRIGDALERAIGDAEKKAVAAAEDLVDAANDAIDGFWQGITDERRIDDLEDSVSEAEKRLAEVLKDEESTPAEVARARDALKDANLRLAQATTDMIFVDAQARESWRETAAAAGLSKQEIDGLIAAYDTLAVSKANAATQREAISAEASAAQSTRAKFGEIAAAGLVSADQMNHLKANSDPAYQLQYMRDIVDAFDRAFMSQVPQMASGGVVKARPGGTLINAAEAGRDEAILPLSSLSELLTSAMASVRPAASELMSSSSSARTSTSEDRSINIGTVVTADNRGMRSELEQLMWSAGAR